MGTGFITEDMMKNFLPKPSADIRIVLCGPPGMIKVMIPMLKKLEYTDEMIFSFI
jgi:cytochrome-b5 reductase